MKECMRILVGMVDLAVPSAAISQTGAVSPGTYELVWFTRHPVTDTSIRARVLLVLSPDALADSLASRMSQAVRSQATRGRACWRLIEGALPMGARGPTVTDWPPLARDTIAITLWFKVDAAVDSDSGLMVSVYEETSSRRGGWSLPAMVERHRVSCTIPCLQVALENPTRVGSFHDGRPNRAV